MKPRFDWAARQRRPPKNCGEIPSIPCETTSGFWGCKRKKIANLLGSSGKKAVALSLLGAQVTIVDITEENQRYALECARAAELICDILKLGGTLVLHEFHPIIKKCAPKQNGDRWVREDDYFSEEIIEKPAPRVFRVFFGVPFQSVNLLLEHKPYTRQPLYIQPHHERISATQ
jgi:hypothetical protein